MATLKSICGSLIRTPILGGLLRKREGIQRSLRAIWCVSTLSAEKNANSHGWGQTGGVATTCSNTDSLVPLGSLPYSEVLAVVGAAK